MRAQMFTLLLFCLPTAISAEQFNALQYEGNVYVSLDTLTEIIDGKAQLTKGARGVLVQAGGKQWEFANGGDRLELPSGETMPLTRPLLVVEGRHYVPLMQCAPAFDCRVEEEGGIQLVHGDKQATIRPRPLQPRYRKHHVTGLRTTHRPVITTGSVTAHRSLYNERDTLTVCAGKTLLVRRRVAIDSKPYFLVTGADSELQSYLVAKRELESKTKLAKLDGTAWEKYSSWFHQQAADERALRFGDRDKLHHNVSLTVDLCWSLRRFEGDFFRSLPQLARQREQDVHAAVFVSGRWLQQHPTEMEALIDLDQQPGVQLTWGLHSWAHPKAAGFLNDFSPEQLREDTFQLERSLLQWGIVPTVYYRFPGLIHDRTRLEEVLRLDLFPVDCESWIALLGSSHPYAHPVTDGSIILVHGNGNEPKGIVRLNDWLVDHPQWRTQPLHRFFMRAGDPPGARD